MLELLKELNKKQVMLRQMIISKYATNSLDIHYILAKAQELQKINDDFYEYILKFMKDKGLILSEFVDLEVRDENEVQQKLNETRKEFMQFNSEINSWMNQKAEPNLIEVERKSTKYKIKWESLKLFEKKEKLLAVLRKKQNLLNTNKWFILQFKFKTLIL